MLKTMFEQFISDGVSYVYKLPNSDSPFSKYMFRRKDGLVLIAEVDSRQPLMDIEALLLLINRDVFKIMSLKFY